MQTQFLQRHKFPKEEMGGKCFTSPAQNCNLHRSAVSNIPKAVQFSASDKRHSLSSSMEPPSSIYLSPSSQSSTTHSPASATYSPSWIHPRNHQHPPIHSPASAQHLQLITYSQLSIHSLSPTHPLIIIHPSTHQHPPIHSPTYTHPPTSIRPPLTNNHLQISTLSLAATHSPTD